LDASISDFFKDDCVILLFNIITIETDITEIKAAVRNIRLYDTGKGKEPILLPLTLHRSNKIIYRRAVIQQINGS
jgi:hypothetical protein